RGATTAEDALRAGKDEFLGSTTPEAFRAIVFFTDGRPTSFRDTFRIGVNDVDGVIGGYSNPNDNHGDPPPWDPPHYRYGIFDPLQVNTPLGIDNPSHLPDGRVANS
ncbi:hypothetical protein KJ567_03770, partial [Candidatus Bipolaricaulota bacterium]|nr:hypothetical protein [Candidatus Bipolaricaulota bacterium]